MHMFRENRNLFIIALIAIVNALGYGIIIPVLYSYSVRYGLSAFENGLLFAIFSLCQFIATPLIGRLSDKYGRRPMLLLSISGTALSFLMMAFAPNALFLFISRALDGITAGNIPVASAVISDTTSERNRAKGFGIIGASFSFGFIFGPVISGLTYDTNPALPFIIAALISLLAVVLVYFFLPETNKHMGEIQTGKLFDFRKLFHALWDENIGMTLLITLFYFMAFTVFITGFQPFAIEILHMTNQQISFLFSAIGVIGLVAQLFVMTYVTKWIGIKHTCMLALAIVSMSFLGMSLFQNIMFYLFFNIVLALMNASIMPLTQTILSKETDAKSQGTILGINASYMSIGQIIGPLIGGVAATMTLSLPFFFAAVLVGICFLLSFHILKPGVPKESAF